MKINKLKAPLIVACCFIIALCSETKCTDVSESKTPYEIKNNYRDYVDSLENDNLEGPKTSWMSYLLSPAKIIIQSACEIMNFAANNPQKSLIIGFCLTNQVVAAAIDNCQYYTSLQDDTVRVWGINCGQEGWKFTFSRPTRFDPLMFGAWGSNCDQKVGCFWPPVYDYSNHFSISNQSFPNF